MPLDNGTSTFADIDRPVNSAVPSKAFYFQRSMDLQYHALRIASWDPYLEEYLQALVEHVYIQYLPYNNFLSQDRDIWRIANTDYSFWFSTFDLGHLTTRDPESRKLSTFFNIPMHLAVIGSMGEETSYKPSSAVGVRVPDGALVAYSVHKVCLSRTCNANLNANLNADTSNPAVYRNPSSQLLPRAPPQRPLPQTLIACISAPSFPRWPKWTTKISS